MKGVFWGERPVDAVVFDLGGTLIDISKPIQAVEKAFIEIAQELIDRGYDPVPGATRLQSAIGEDVDAIFAQREADGEQTEVNHADVLRDAYSSLGLQLDDETLHKVMEIEQRAWWSGVSLAEGAIETLVTLRSRGVALGVCSNAPYHPPLTRKLLDQLGVAGLVDSIVLSAEVGYRKPSPKMFAAAAAGLACDPPRMVFVGDRAREDVEGAKATGMLTAMVTKADPLSKDHIADAIVNRLTEIPELFSPAPAGGMATTQLEKWGAQI